MRKMLALILLLICVFPAQSDSRENHVREAICWLNPCSINGAIDRIAKKNSPLLVLPPDSFLRSLKGIAKLKRLNPQVKVVIYWCPNSFKDPRAKNAGRGLYNAEKFMGKMYEEVERKQRWILRDLDKPNTKLYIWFKPPMYLVNTTRHCPRVSGQTYNEWWVDYITRNLISHPSYAHLIDGVYVDCLWHVVSHLIQYNKYFSTSVDFNGNGQLDEVQTYQAIDSVWRDGNRNLVSLLRKALPGKIIIGNHINLNFCNEIQPGGKLLEGFPGNEFRRDWNRTMLHMWALDRKLGQNMVMLDKQGSSDYFYFGLTSVLLTNARITPWIDRVSMYQLSGKKLQGAFIGKKNVTSLQSLGSWLGKPLGVAVNPHDIIVHETFEQRTDLTRIRLVMMDRQAAMLSSKEPLVFSENFPAGKYSMSFKHAMSSACTSVDVLFFDQYGDVVSSFKVSNRWPVTYLVQDIVLSRDAVRLSIIVRGNATCIIDDVLVWRYRNPGWSKAAAFLTFSEQGTNARMSFAPGKYNFVYAVDPMRHLQAGVSLRLLDTRGKVLSQQTVEVPSDKRYARIDVVMTTPFICDPSGARSFPAQNCRLDKVQVFQYSAPLWYRTYEGGTVYVNTSKSPLYSPEGYLIPARSGRIFLK